MMYKIRDIVLKYFRNYLFYINKSISQQRDDYALYARGRELFGSGERPMNNYDLAALDRYMDEQW